MGKPTSVKPASKKNPYQMYFAHVRDEYQKKNPGQKIVMANMSKDCSEKWKSISEKEKSKYIEMAARDKARFEKEMKNYTPPPGEEVSGKKSRKVKKFKDPNAPKRPLSGYFIFTADQRAKILAATPGIKVGDIAKECGRLWREASEEVKAKYMKLADADKARYAKEMESYQKKTGPVAKGKAASGKAVVVEESEEEDEDDDYEDE